MRAFVYRSIKVMKTWVVESNQGTEVQSIKMVDQYNFETIKSHIKGSLVGLANLSNLVQISNLHIIHLKRAQDRPQVRLQLIKINF